MEVTRALSTGRRLLREHGLDDWTIVADRAKLRAGVCRYSRRQIGISAPLTTLHDEAEVLDTILHEIAHALVGPHHGHDAVWRAKAREIGSSGRQYVSPEAPRVPKDWVGRCPVGHEKSRHRGPHPADVVRAVLAALRPRPPVHVDLPGPPRHAAALVRRPAVGSRDHQPPAVGSAPAAAPR